MPLTDEKRFAHALRQLGQMHSKSVDRALAERYWEVLKDRLTDEQFAAACKQLDAAEWFPTPARILNAGRASRPVVERAEDVELYERVLNDCQEYSPTVGTYFRRPVVEARLGPAAALAFQAAGGAPAFLSALHDPEREPWVRREFLEAARALREDPAVLAQIERAAPVAQLRTRTERPTLPPAAAHKA